MEPALDPVPEEAVEGAQIPRVKLAVEDEKRHGRAHEIEGQDVALGDALPTSYTARKHTP